ncbi:MAG: peptidoglycan-binding protein [Lachnospiraceae bacterium]|nr:peptidoglycan-binding protein [Lachnospiraceae bacterium]
MVTGIEASKYLISHSANTERTDCVTKASEHERNIDNKSANGCLDGIGAIYYHQKENGILNSVDGKVVMKGAPNDTETKKQYQSKLSALGFYSGPIDGNMGSDICKKAIKNFQKVYGLSEDGNMTSATRKKLNAAHNTYVKVSSSNEFKNLLNYKPDGKTKIFNYDASQRENFARVCAFLKNSMGLNSVQIAGVLGNMHYESQMSSDNANDNAGYKKVHDTSYKYSTGDGVAYGLIQWHYRSRKQGLLDTANSMGLRFSDANAQLAWLKTEIDSGNYSSWKNEKSSVNRSTELFADDIINNSSEAGMRKRKEAANAIYDLMKNVL